METISVAVICTVFGAVLAYLNFQRNKDKDTKETARENSSIVTKIDYIVKNIDEIRVDSKVQDRRIGDLESRVIRVEESSKSAHHRIDGLEEDR